MPENYSLSAICEGNDVIWDIDLSWDTTTPRFTRCLRQTVLTWVPCLFLWVFALVEVVNISRSKSLLTPWNVFNIVRLTLSSFCLLLNISELGYHVYRFFDSNDSQSLGFISALLKVATFILFTIFLLYHRWRGVHTSGVLWIFVLLSVISALPPYIQLWLDSSAFLEFEYYYYLIYFPVICGIFILISFSDAPGEYKTTAVDPQDEQGVRGPTARVQSPEDCASFPSKLTFWWFNKLAWFGYRNPLKETDLWQLPDDYVCANLCPKFQKNLNFGQQDRPVTFSDVSYSNGSAYVISSKASDSKKAPVGLARALIKTFGWPMLFGALLKFVSDILQFTNPQLLKLLLNFIKNTGEEPLWHGFVWASMMFVVASLQSLVLNAYFHRMFLVGMRIRTSLVGTIYKKSLSLSHLARKDTTVGEIVNLMSVDAQRFQDLMTYFNLLWSAPLQICLAVFFLYRELGASVFAGLLIMVIVLPINGGIAALSKKFQVKQMKLKDERVKFMNEILSGMKVLKLYAWEESFIKLILGVRSKEIRQLKKVSYLGCVTSFIWTCTPIMVSLVTFAIYVIVDKSHVLDAQKAFVSLALFNLLRFPLTMLPMLISNLVMAAVSLKRLNKFLRAKDLRNYVTSNESTNVVDIENGTFAWEAEQVNETAANGETEAATQKFSLSRIDLQIPKGSFVAIVGNVGSGKTSLISAILGEMECQKGSVNICSGQTVGYVSQQAWIENLSLRENVLFGKPYEKSKYERVLNSCALRPDIAMLAAGDSTEIGEKGINLSGGQKQRVSLARACYFDADLYLLDDPLSAVDAHVGKHIFDRVLSSKTGLLKDKTRVLATNSVDILPKVDKIVVLKNGEVSETGTYEELMDRKGHFSEFVTQYASKRDDKTGQNLVSRAESVEETLARTQSVEKKEPKVNTEAKIIDTEKSQTGKVKLAVYLLYFKTVTWFWIVLIILTTGGSQVASVASNIWLADWSNDNSTQQNDSEQRNHRLLIYGLIGGAQSVFAVFSSLSLVVGSMKAAITLHERLLNRIFRSPMSFFDTTPLGRIVNRFSKDIDTVDDVLPNTIRMWLLCILQVLAVFIVNTFSTWYFVVAVLPIAVVYYIIQKVYVASSRQLKRLESVTRSPIYSHFSETLTGVSTIRAYNVTQRFINESNNRVDTNIACYYPSIISNRWLAVRLEFCGNMIILFAAIFAVLNRGTLSAGAVGLTVTYALSVTQTLSWMVRMSSELETNIVAVERIAEYCDNPTEAEWVNEQNQPPKDWPANGDIVFKDYSARYRPGMDLVLKDINASVNSMEKVGIVGRTGAGKSTITLSLFRIVEPAKGRIEIDGVDIGRLGLHDLRNKLTIIPQDPVLFSGNLRFNLDPFEHYTDEQIWQALEHAHLKTFVKSLEAGLNHQISEGGSNLSVGQKQLVCLARALLRKTKILVLDEATAAVDLETDSLIQSTIRSEFKDCTILTIAHRLNTILDSTRVLVLDKGVVKEFDPPSVLLSEKNSIFYSLAKDGGIVSHQS